MTRTEREFSHLGGVLRFVIRWRSDSLSFASDSLFCFWETRFARWLTRAHSRRHHEYCWASERATRRLDFDSVAHLFFATQFQILIAGIALDEKGVALLFAEVRGLSCCYWCWYFQRIALFRDSGHWPQYTLIHPTQHLINQTVSQIQADISRVSTLASWCQN